MASVLARGAASSKRKLPADAPLPSAPSQRAEGRAATFALLFRVASAMDDIFSFVSLPDGAALSGTVRAFGGRTRATSIRQRADLDELRHECEEICMPTFSPRSLGRS